MTGTAGEGRSGVEREDQGHGPNCCAQACVHVRLLWVIEFRRCQETGRGSMEFRPRADGRRNSLHLSPPIFTPSGCGRVDGAALSVQPCCSESERAELRQCGERRYGPTAEVPTLRGLVRRMALAPHSNHRASGFHFRGSIMPALWSSSNLAQPTPIKQPSHVSRIRLSDWIHREAYGKKWAARVFCLAYFSPSPRDTARRAWDWGLLPDTTSAGVSRP
jgi:hypothetical protein